MFWRVASRDCSKKKMYHLPNAMRYDGCMTYACFSWKIFIIATKWCEVTLPTKNKFIKNSKKEFFSRFINLLRRFFYSQSWLESSFFFFKKKNWEYENQALWCMTRMLPFIHRIYYMYCTLYKYMYVQIKNLFSNQLRKHVYVNVTRGDI